MAGREERPAQGAGTQVRFVPAPLQAEGGNDKEVTEGYPPHGDTPLLYVTTRPAE